MTDVKETVLLVLFTVVAAELICKFCPEKQMAHFIKGLVTVLLLASVLTGIWKSDFDFALPSGEVQLEDSELGAFVDEKYEAVVREETTKYIKGLLATIEVEPKKIEIIIKTDSENGINVERVRITLKYETDRERALALVQSVLGDEYDVEVKTDG